MPFYDEVTVGVALCLIGYFVEESAVEGGSHEVIDCLVFKHYIVIEYIISSRKWFYLTIVAFMSIIFVGSFFAHAVSEIPITTKSKTAIITNVLLRLFNCVFVVCIPKLPHQNQQQGLS